MMAIAISVTLPALGDRPAVFGRVRACGTVGFMAAVLVFPALAARYGAARDPAGLHWMFPAAALLAALASIAALALPRAGRSAARAAPGEWRSLLRNTAFVRLLVLSFLAFAFLNGPMEFFPRLVAARGGDAVVVSHLWVVMLVPEIALLLGFRQADRLGARWLLAVGIGAGGLRWVLTGSLETMSWLFVTQALHAVVVVGLMLGAPLYIHKCVPLRLQSTAQGLHGAAALGVGGALSSLCTGWLIDTAGIATPFWAGGLLALLLAIALPLTLPREALSTESGSEGASVSRPTGNAARP